MTPFEVASAAGVGAAAYAVATMFRRRAVRDIDRKDEPMMTLRVELDADTVSIVELGTDNGEGVATLYSIAGACPLPRRTLARLLRGLADRAEAEADELDELEPH